MCGGAGGAVDRSPELAWNRTRVAAELEGLFHRIGQRVQGLRRSTGQASGRAASWCVPARVAALEEGENRREGGASAVQAVHRGPVLWPAALALGRHRVIVLRRLRALSGERPGAGVTLADSTYTTLTADGRVPCGWRGADVRFHDPMSGRTREAVASPSPRSRRRGLAEGDPE